MPTGCDLASPTPYRASRVTTSVAPLHTGTTGASDRPALMESLPRPPTASCSTPPAGPRGPSPRCHILSRCWLASAPPPWHVWGLCPSWFQLRARLGPWFSWRYCFLCEILRTNLLKNYYHMEKRGLCRWKTLSIVVLWQSWRCSVCCIADTAYNCYLYLVTVFCLIFYKQKENDKLILCTIWS